MVLPYTEQVGADHRVNDNCGGSRLSMVSCDRQPVADNKDCDQVQWLYSELSSKASRHYSGTALQVHTWIEDTFSRLKHHIIAMHLKTRTPRFFIHTFSVQED